MDKGSLETHAGSWKELAPQESALCWWCRRSASETERRAGFPRLRGSPETLPRWKDLGSEPKGMNYPLWGGSEEAASEQRAVSERLCHIGALQGVYVDGHRAGKVSQSPILGML